MPDPRHDATAHRILVDHLATQHHIATPDQLDEDLTVLHDGLHNQSPHIGRYHTADGAHTDDPWAGGNPSGDVWIDTGRSPYLKEFDVLALHLVSEHGFTAYALGQTFEELVELHGHEHSASGTIRNHEPESRAFLPAKVAAAIRNHDHALVPLPLRVSALQARIDATHQPTAEQQLAEIRAVLLTALGGRDGVPNGATVADMARAVAANLTQRDDAITTARRIEGDARDRLTEALTVTGHRDEGDTSWTPLVGLADTVANLAITYHRGVHEAAPAAHARKFGDALRRIYNTINNAESINQYGDITRRAALVPVVDIALKNGVDL